MLFYILFLTIIRYKSVTLRFLIPGHTKNRCDGAFGLIKKTIKHRDIECPADMFTAIRDSSRKTMALEATSVMWRDWKTFLEQYFTLPSSLKMNSYYIFRAREETPGVLDVKKYSDSREWTHFRMFKKNVQARDVGVNSSSILHTQYELKVTPLHHVKATAKKSRVEYLEHEVCNRYYKDNTAFRNKYFDSGTNWSKS